MPNQKKARELNEPSGGGGTARRFAGRHGKLRPGSHRANASQGVRKYLSFSSARTRARVEIASVFKVSSVGKPGAFLAVSVPKDALGTSTTTTAVQNIARKRKIIRDSGRDGAILHGEVLSRVEV